MSFPRVFDSLCFASNIYGFKHVTFSPSRGWFQLHFGTWISLSWVLNPRTFPIFAFFKGNVWGMPNVSLHVKSHSLIYLLGRWLEIIKILKTILLGTQSSATQTFNYKLTSNKAECQRATAITLTLQFYCGHYYSKSLPWRSFLIK